ncbi:MAG: diphthine synthase [Candidatus Micrarchaeia archaeon]
MLFLVGTGISSKDLTISAIEIMKKSELYADTYTSNIDTNALNLIEAATGKNISMLSRSDMEENVHVIVGRAKDHDVSIIIGGDPLIATTHKTIAIEAKKQGVPIEVMHSSSIITVAIGESGLDFYKFGNACTIPRWHEHYKPVSFYQTLLSNRRSNLHSLMLLDYDSKSSASIPINEAIGILEEAEKVYHNGLINESTKLLALLNLGRPNIKKVYGALGTLKNSKFESGPAVMILPSELADIEIESMHALNIVEIG